MLSSLSLPVIGALPRKCSCGKSAAMLSIAATADESVENSRPPIWSRSDEERSRTPDHSPGASEYKPSA